MSAMKKDLTVSYLLFSGIAFILVLLNFVMLLSFNVYNLSDGNFGFSSIALTQFSFLFFTLMLGTGMALQFIVRPKNVLIILMSIILSNLVILFGALINIPLIGIYLFTFVQNILILLPFLSGVIVVEYVYYGSSKYSVDKSHKENVSNIIGSSKERKENKTKTTNSTTPPLPPPPIPPFPTTPPPPPPPPPPVKETEEHAKKDEEITVKDDTETYDKLFGILYFDDLDETEEDVKNINTEIVDNVENSKIIPTRVEEDGSFEILHFDDEDETDKHWKRNEVNDDTVEDDTVEIIKSTENEKISDLFNIENSNTVTIKEKNMSNISEHFDKKIAEIKETLLKISSENEKITVDDYYKLFGFDVEEGLFWEGNMYLEELKNTGFLSIDGEIITILD